MTENEKKVYVYGYLDGVLETITRNNAQDLSISAFPPKVEEIEAIIEAMNNFYQTYDLENIYLFRLMPIAISHVRWPDAEIGADASIRGLQYQAHNK